MADQVRDKAQEAWDEYAARSGLSDVRKVSWSAGNTQSAYFAFKAAWAAATASHAADVEALRSALQATADMLGSACHFVSKNNGLMQMLAQVDAARAALKGDKP